MSNIVKQEEQRNIALSTAVSTAAQIISKDYLSTLDKLPIVPLSQEQLDIDISQCATLYHLKRLVLNRDEHFLDKLTTITNVVANVDSSLTTIIHSNGTTVDYYIGMISKKYRVKNKKDQDIRAAVSDAFSGAMEGNFAGSTLEQLSPEDVTQLHQQIFHEKVSDASAISGVVSLRSRDQQDMAHYVQGIENLTHALRGKRYTIMLVADPISTQQIQSIKQGYEMLYTELSAFARSSITFNETDSMTLSHSRSEGISQSITEGVSRTQSHGTSYGQNKGFNIGISGGIGFPGVAYAGLNTGFSSGTSKGTTEMNASGTNSSVSDQTSTQTGRSTASMQGRGKSLQISAENRSVKDLLDKLDQQIQRLALCESFGAFDCAAYVLTENTRDGMAVSSNYNALMRGEDSFVQSSHINHWRQEPLTGYRTGGERPQNKYKTLLQYLQAFVHPVFQLDTHQNITVTPACQLSGRELAIQFGLPKKSINGLSVLEMTPFGRNPEPAGDMSIHLGQLYYMGQDERVSVPLDAESLSSHVFITGSTGSGKSNTVYQMLEQLSRQDIKFMVIEPAKGEYKHVFGNREDVTVLGTNPAYTQLLNINPFCFPEGVHVLEHIDRLVEIFNVCWPMYAAMPAVLKEAILGAYVGCGWELLTSKNPRGAYFPSFQDVEQEVLQVIQQSAYSDEVKGNYVGSLATRLKSLTNGLNGAIFSQQETDNRILFDSNVIIDLSRVGSQETKSLIMGILVMRLSEHRMSNTEEMNAPLRHITVLEEAHNLLKRNAGSGSIEGGNLAEKSVELLSNAIAEMRTYGEGFFIVDQSPSAVDLSAIRNTNTKIVMRLPDESDRRLAGKSAALQDGQLDEIAKLPKGVAVIYQNHWQEPVLCHVDRFAGESAPYQYHVPPANQISDKKAIGALVSFLLKGRVSDDGAIDLPNLRQQLDGLSQLGGKQLATINELLDEYEADGTLDLWEIHNFGLLSRLVTEVLGVEEGVIRATKTAKSYEGLQSDLEKLVGNTTEELSSELTMNVCHSLMRHSAEYNQTHLAIYTAWKEAIERGAGIR